MKNAGWLINVLAESVGRDNHVSSGTLDWQIWFKISNGYARLACVVLDSIIFIPLADW